MEHVREKGGALCLFLNQGLIQLPEASDSRDGWWTPAVKRRKDFRLIPIEDDDSDCQATASKNGLSTPYVGPCLDTRPPGKRPGRDLTLAGGSNYFGSNAVDGRTNPKVALTSRNRTIYASIKRRPSTPESGCDG
jgi:hypothetical protein